MKAALSVLLDPVYIWVWELQDSRYWASRRRAGRTDDGEKNGHTTNSDRLMITH